MPQFPNLDPVAVVGDIQDTDELLLDQVDEARRVSVTLLGEKVQSNLTLGSDDITNDSTVFGATVSDSLEDIVQDIADLDGSQIQNNSSVTGSTVEAALETLGADLGRTVTRIRTTDVVSSATPGIASELLPLAPILANTQYLLEGVILLKDTEDRGFILSLTLPASGDTVSTLTTTFSTTGDTGATIQRIAHEPTGTSPALVQTITTAITLLPVPIRAVITVGATGGDLEFEFGRTTGVGVGGITALTGSWITIEKVS